MGTRTEGGELNQPVQPVPMWPCKARASACDPPQDCDKPFCGCNPAWTDALDSALESGWLTDSEARERSEKIMQALGFFEGDVDVVPAVARVVERLGVVQGQLREMHDAARAYIAAHGTQRVVFQDAAAAHNYEASGIRLEELCGLRRLPEPRGRR